MARAIQVKDSFPPEFGVSVVDNLCSLPSAPDVVIGTISADATLEEDSPSALFSKARGLCIGMADNPCLTPLLAKAGKEGWQTVDDTLALLEQGYKQFEMWLGLDAPKDVMRGALEAHNASNSRL
ncbi:hypothetical protein LTR66_003272 [Elasticomyces elasticus]|nr:hypothetical protein LTR66_003272 [Elasticomyces elasticus]KAK5002093.1 hypothetical protein LTR28_011843 [Elasticomyces elasticus]